MSPLEKSESTVVMTADAIAEAVNRLAQEIVDANPDVRSLALLGILSRGRPLADRLAKRIAEMTGLYPKVGSLATTFYRDDFRSGIGDISKARPEPTYFDFSINDMTVILVDDVLAAGRTIRAAMDEVMDYGRPARIQLACLVDRGGRELPIQPDYLSRTVATKKSEYVSVRLSEMDGEDVVLLEHRTAQPDSQQGGA